MGNSNHSTGVRQVYDYWVLGPSGFKLPRCLSPHWELRGGGGQGRGDARGDIHQVIPITPTKTHSVIREALALV